MADVNIQQTPQPVASGGSSGAVWAVVVLVLIGILAWFIFGGGLNRTDTTKIEIKSGEVAPAPSGGSGGGAQPATPSRGGTGRGG